MPTRQKCQISASNQLQSPRIHPSIPWNASKLITIDSNSSQIVTNCLVCLRIAPTMSQIHRNWSEINANRLKLLCSFPNHLEFVSQASESSQMSSPSPQMLLMTYPLVSRCQNWCHSVPKTVSKTSVTNLKVFLVAAHSIVLAQWTVITT